MIAADVIGLQPFVQAVETAIPAIVGIGILFVLAFVVVFRR